MKIIIPKRFVNLTNYRGVPLFFLGGPVVGGGEWQQRMCRAILLQQHESIIVVPNRWDTAHPLAEHFLEEASGPLVRFEDQLAYEMHYLDFAGITWRPGCIIFWLAVQREPRPPALGPYGQDSYGEVGEWRGRMMCSNEKIRLVIGAEAGFPGLDTIRRNYSRRLRCDFPIYKTMEETVSAALKMATSE